MSRTTRKPLRSIEENEESYIKHQLSSRFRRWNKGDNYSTRTVRRKKPNEQYEAEWEAAWALYHEQLKKARYDEYGHPYIWSTGWISFREVRVHEPYVSKYHRIEVPWSLEQEIEELKKQYRKFTRDGHWNETSRNTGYKHACDKDFRNKTRGMIHKVMHDKVDPDNAVFPDRKDGKQKVWDFW
jgi:hypothetical protein